VTNHVHHCAYCFAGRVLLGVLTVLAILYIMFWAIGAHAFDAPRDEEKCLPAVQGRCILIDDVQAALPPVGHQDEIQVYVLIIFMKYGSAGGAASQEFSTKEACREAERILHAEWTTGLYTFCVPK